MMRTAVLSEQGMLAWKMAFGRAETPTYAKALAWIRLAILKSHALSLVHPVLQF